MSSIYDDSVLIQVPSGYGVGKLYSVIPNTPVGDFDVTRSSWTTRVNKYGYIENVVANVPRLNYDSGVVCPYLLTEDAGTNLITYPISFGNSYWTKSGASIEADSSTAGSELVTNGDFATDSDWIKGAGWSISGGTANHDGLSTGVGIAQNTGITTAGILYKYTFTILNKGVGTLDVRLRSATDSATILTGLSEEGTYTAYYTATSTGVDIVPLSGNTASFSIDNVSVKEVQPFEAPKVKPTLGSELVTNGNFEDGSTDWTFQSSWSISGGKANYDAVTTQDYLKQTMSSIAAGKTVKIQFDISDVQAGKNAFLKLEISGTPELVFTYTTFTEGTYTYYHTITSGLDRLNFV
ncbi:hypothetical protein HN803_07345, partial [candidate division WWE3 bacterium]|nr:hypothetical protein [candidate division WWE3 bacterium]